MSNLSSVIQVSSVKPGSFGGAVFSGRIIGQNKIYTCRASYKVITRIPQPGECWQFNGQRIRSSGIAKLRDADVIITSAAKGYKIPQTRADINEFLERASGIVVPLLERVKKAREVYRLSSRGEYDIVTAAKLAELAKLLAALEAFADD